MNGVPRASVAVVGCRVNQSEAEEIELDLERAGYEPVEFPGPAEVVVVHTCYVTARAEADCRWLIRAALRANPAARIVASGCFAQVASERIAALGGVALVAGTAGWHDIGALLGTSEPGGSKPGVAIAVGEPGERGFEGADRKSTGTRRSRSRALLKVQDGCSRRCSFCVVPSARGPARSLPADRALARARALAAEGYGEIVLTGANLGTWGRDLDPRQSLEDLVARIEDGLEGETGPRLRLSSIDPRDLSTGLIERIARSDRICPHLHVSLQSADDEILREMGRGIGSERLRDTLDRALSEIRGLALGLDVMVGFPGETDDAFRRTEAFLATLGIAYLHVFPFSPRPGTAAASRPGRPAIATVRERAWRLRALSGARRRTFQGSRVGKPLRVIVEARARVPAPGWVRSTSREYIPVFLRRGGWPFGREISVVATGLRESGLVARAVDG